MTSAINVPKEVNQIVSRVNGTSTAASDNRLHEILALLRELPEIEAVETLAFRYKEFEIRVGLLSGLKSHLDALRLAAPLCLSAAPSLVEYIPIDEREGVLIVRYAACPGERLTRVETTTEPFREVASRRFRADMQTLIEHGLVHPFVRGPHHWLISSETGTLVLDSWYALRACDPEEGAEMLAKIDRQLETRRENTHAKVEPVIQNAPKNRIEEVFGCPRVLLPVVHPVDRDTAIASVRVAHGAGVKGIFLINQGMSTEQVLDLVMVVRAELPALWVGLNLLGVPPAQVLARGLAACAGRLDGIWSDNAHVEEDAATQPAAHELVEARRTHGWTGLYFGGVAFKYQREVPAAALGRAAATALPYMDVVCTSGPGTGQAADVDKVLAMRAGLGARGALALASGVTEGNVAAYLPYVDAYLVGTGIERGFGVLEPDRVARLNQIIDAASARVA